MVEFKKSITAKHGPYLPSRDSYWKLGLHYDKTARGIYGYLHDHGFKCRQTANKGAALKALGRYQRGLLAYDACSMDELQSFCKARALSQIAKTASGFVRVLEKADDHAKFRLLDLPPEIRNIIYNIHFETFDTVVLQCNQPPLTLAGSQLRNETLPLFYGVTTFDCDLIRYPSSGNGLYPGCWFKELKDMHFIHVSQIKNLSITFHWIYPWGESRNLTLASLALRSETGRVPNAVECHVTGFDGLLRSVLQECGYWNDDFKLKQEHIEALGKAAFSVH